MQLGMPIRYCFRTHVPIRNLHMMFSPILLVEDNPPDLDLMQIALERAELANDIVVTRDGQEALDYLFGDGVYASRAKGNPAFILLDLKMPKLDGLEVLKVVRSVPETAQIPIVMLTSSREHQDLATSYESGVNAFVVKPYEFSALTDAVAQIAAFWSKHNTRPSVVNR